MVWCSRMKFSNPKKINLAAKYFVYNSSPGHKNCIQLILSGDNCIQ